MHVSVEIDQYQIKNNVNKKTSKNNSTNVSFVGLMSTNLYSVNVSGALLLYPRLNSGSLAPDGSLGGMVSADAVECE